MITKKQWLEFCSVVDRALFNSGFNTSVTIQGKRVFHTKNGVIIVDSCGTRQLLRHPEEIDNSMTLSRLYSMVRAQTTLDDFNALLLRSRQK